MSQSKQENQKTQFNFLVDPNDKKAIIRIAQLLGIEVKEFMGKEVKKIIENYQEKLKSGEQLKAQSNATQSFSSSPSSTPP